MVQRKTKYRWEDRQRHFERLERVRAIEKRMRYFRSQCFVAERDISLKFLKSIIYFEGEPAPRDRHALNGNEGTTNPSRYFEVRTADDPGENQKSS